jgi:two-component system, sensor histidine kinase and response regulator
MTAPWSRASMDEGRTSTALLTSAAPIGAARVLLVDDNVMSQEIIATILCYAGYEVAVVANGQAALEAVRSSEFSLVLMDLDMPVMGGIEAAQRIRALGGRAGRIPIVAVTAYSMDGAEAEHCRSAGMDDFLTKPTGMRRVLQLAAHWTGGADAAD